MELTRDARVSRRSLRLTALVVVGGLWLAPGSLAGWTWDLPAGTPPPRVPADNPMSAEKVELGRRLFFDTRLSADGSMSCATCHRPELAFTDGRRQPVGVTGERHPRGAMSLINVAYATSFGWDDPTVRRLEEQLTIPLFGHEPIEMGARPSGVVERLTADPEMVRAFARVFTPRVVLTGDAESAGPLVDGPLSEAARAVTVDHLAKAIAAYERTLIATDSPFDRFWRGDEDALAPAARRGQKLFFSRRVGCSQCHRGFNLSGPVEFAGSRDRPSRSPTDGFRDNGRVPDRPGPEVPRDRRGLARHTGDPADIGRFKVPTLRNIARTAPYMHDGSLATLDAVIDHYASGGLDTNDIEPFTLDADERRDLLAFLAALDDPGSTVNLDAPAAPRDPPTPAGGDVR